MRLQAISYKKSESDLLSLISYIQHCVSFHFNLHIDFFACSRSMFQQALSFQLLHGVSPKVLKLFFWQWQCYATELIAFLHAGISN